MKRLGFVLLGLWPAAAHACAVCGGGVDRTRGAFFGTTILLSLLPLGMIGGGLWWLRRNASDYDPREFMDRDAVPPPAPGETSPLPPDAGGGIKPR